MTPATASLRGLAMLAVGVVVLLAGGAPGADAATTRPSLSIAIDNGHTSTTVGDVLVYTITVRNLGTKAADKLYIGQSLPTGLTFRSAKPVAKPRSGAIGWTVDLRPGATTTLHSTSVVTKTAPDILRLASVACASSSPTAAPIVCASHSDQLPAGALQAARQGAPAVDGAPRTPWAAIAGIAGGGAVVVAAVVLVARRRRLSPP